MWSQGLIHGLTVGKNDQVPWISIIYHMTLLHFFSFFSNLSFSPDWFVVLVPLAVALVFLCCYIFLRNRICRFQWTRWAFAVIRIIIINLCLWNLSSVRRTHVWIGVLYDHRLPHFFRSYGPWKYWPINEVRDIFSKYKEYHHHILPIIFLLDIVH